MAKTRSQTLEQRRKQILQDMLDRPGMKNTKDINAALKAAEKEWKEEQRTGRGIKKPKKGKGIRKPPKRHVKVSQEEKNKNRLRLVVAQIQAGNTNPKLIQEVNKLYKDLHDIECAYMMLKM
jgi:hypothetical protein